MKERKMNDKGLTLIELVVAIALMAIIFLPVMSTFITGGRINRNSRKMMLETELAQTIMEGFTDKTFEDVKSNISNLGAATLSGNNAFSNLDGGYYNEKDNGSKLTWATVQSDSGVNPISIVQVSVSGNTYNNISVVSDNSVSLNQAIGSHMVTAATPWPKGIYGTAEGTGKIAAIVYTGLEREGYHYDAVVTFLPMAKSASDLYYSYSVEVALYEYDPEDETSHFVNRNLSISSGILNE